MPRYYFDVREGESFIRDEEGLDLDGLDKAEREAAEAAAAIGRDLLPKGKLRDITVDVRGEHGDRLLTVTVTLTIQRVSS